MNTPKDQTHQITSLSVETNGSEETDYTVSGVVGSPDRAGVQELRVDIVDKNVGEDVLLVQAATDDRGRYEATFPASSLRERQKQHPDLQTRVFAGDTFVGASEVRYNAGHNETLNVELPANSRALAGEHETLVNALFAHFKRPLREVKETREREDITYLANKTGWDARAVALAALADKFSQDTADPNGRTTIKPAFYYALFRAGLPANPDTLFRADAQTVKQVLTKAVDQGVISGVTNDEVNAAAQSFQKLSAQKLLTAPAIIGTSPLKDLLSVSRLTATQQARFAELYTENRQDLNKFWTQIRTEFGPETAQRLQVDGKLNFVTLNNAALIRNLQTAIGANGISDPVQLAQNGFHRPSAWTRLLDNNVAVPKEIPGENDAARKANYAEYLAAQVRISYPTASVAEMVRSGDLTVGSPERVAGFFNEHQGKFEIGTMPVGQYIARNNVTVERETLTQVKQLERVHQITPNDRAMNTLMKRGLRSAAEVVSFDRETFIQKFADEMGGAAVAAQTYDKSVQIHTAVLNIVVGYATALNGIAVGSKPLATGENVAAGENGAGVAADGDNERALIRPAPLAPEEVEDRARDVIAYPTLEQLFGEMDFCACDHCRSILSPAAYLVDLLQFLDQEPTEAGKANPLSVLLERRPDIQHLPLTCENTNTALPYIDVVNETLEYFIANGVQALTLRDYLGHDTGTASSEDLLASPQFVMNSAYTTLRNERFPIPLPFHQPLENLRRYFDKFEVPLPLAMERLRVNDQLERGTNTYGWRDILMEELRLSRDEHEVLTDSAANPLWRIYGLPNGTSDADVIATLSNAKQFSRRLNITYEELVDILKTRFINPNSDLVPKLERLGVSIGDLQALKNNTLSDADFDKKLPTGAHAPDPAQYDGEIKAWVRKQENFDRIMALITLVDPSEEPDPCNFDFLEFRFARPITAPTDTSTRLGAAEFVRLLRFIRLWKKLGWTIEQTDAAICALFPVPNFPLGAAAIDTVAKLDAGFLLLLPRLGLTLRIMKALNLNAKRDLMSLFTLWSPLGTHGPNALYRKMFLNVTTLTQDPAFADNGSGEFLRDNTQKISDHAVTLRAAFGLTGDEFDEVIAALSFSAANLTFDNISAIYRHGWLARKLRISVRELVLLKRHTGLDPFAPPDATNPAILRLIELVQTLRARSLKTASALYLIWNQDLSGKSAPDADDLTEFARTLRADFASIDDQFSAVEDPGGNIARARMTLVYGAEATDTFFNLLEDTVTLDVSYTHSQPVLQPAILNESRPAPTSDPKIAYDDLRHRLSFTGLLSATKAGALKTAGALPAFSTAVDALFARSEDVQGSFFSRHPELKTLFTAYRTSAAPVEDKRKALLAAFSPELSRRRKRQQALQRLSAAANSDLTFTQSLLDPNAAAPFPLHATGDVNRAALDDVIGVEKTGFAASFFFRDTATGTVDLNTTTNTIDYTASGKKLPANPTAGAAISGLWTGRVETPESGFYNLVVEADAGATVTLTLDGQPIALIQNGTVWRNNNPLELAVALHDVDFSVERVRNSVSFKWETPKSAREVVPQRYLYPPGILQPFQDAYVRFLKAASLAQALRLTGNEISFFATHADYRINGDGWLNALAVNGEAVSPVSEALLKPFRDLLEFARIKSEISPAGESLLELLRNPAEADADGSLYSLTRWDKPSVASLLTHFTLTFADLARLDQFRRVSDVFDLLRKMGLVASALIKATTNEPVATTVVDLQSALRARYEADSWRSVVQPINDSMRALQRDALVAYILHRMRANATTRHIDTADKLFEFFLMDVQMEPCMQTSRIRHALSSVQLFIERCFMNLEQPRVSMAPPAGQSPDAPGKAKQWEWMKRYRVWEANRKVFLYPENWLEPELRDNKSPFFKEVESELLQGDITDDAAAVALLNYLSQLQEVAKLEPCGIHHTPANEELRTGEVNHVIARTSGAHRKYYYRRFEYGYWTPWEQVKLEIEDDPVIPVVWNGRLLFFWGRILKEAPINAAELPATSNTPGEIGKLTLSTIRGEAKSTAQSNARVTLRAVLCWSEYYNGKWQPAKTSDLNRPVELGVFDAGGPRAFDRTKLWLSAHEVEGTLRISFHSGNMGSFYLYNTHSAPVRQEDVDFLDLLLPAPSRHIEVLDKDLTISYGSGLLFLNPEGGLSGKTLDRKVLENSLKDRVVEPDHDTTDSWDAPFFYEDSRHVFYVTTTEKLVRVIDFTAFHVEPDEKKLDPRIPPFLVAELQQSQPKPKIGPDDFRSEPDFRVVNPAPLRRFITEDANIRRGIGATGEVKFGDVLIGPGGAIKQTGR